MAGSWQFFWHSLVTPPDLTSNLTCYKHEPTSQPLCGVLNGSDSLYVERNQSQAFSPWDQLLHMYICSFVSLVGGCHKHRVTVYDTLINGCLGRTSYRVPSPARWPRSARNSLDESSYGALYPWNPLVGTGVSRFLLHCKFVCLLHPRGHVGRANPLLSVHNPLHSCIKEILGC